MTPLAKLGLYGVVLVGMLGAGAAAGAVVGPIDTSEDTTAHAHEDMANDATAALPAGGLQVSEGGFTLVPERRTLDAPTFSFTITGPDGRPVTRYDELHDRRLHLIVASRDLHDYAHVHPSLGDDGAWTVTLPVLPGGSYRAFADFQPTDADHHTLGIDVTVPGTVASPAPLVVSDRDRVAGFDVSLDPSRDGDRVTVTVRRGGAVGTTQPYLGAAGHLVALRDGDLAHLHVHPLDEQPRGPVAFAVEYPSVGRYALFFDFQVDGEVHTARFVVDATPATEGH